MRAKRVGWKDTDLLSQENIIPLGNKDKGRSHLLGVLYLASHPSPIPATSLDAL